VGLFGFQTSARMEYFSSISFNGVAIRGKFNSELTQSVELTASPGNESSKSYL
jgi:hypothetical protein